VHTHNIRTNLTTMNKQVYLSIVIINAIMLMPLFFNSCIQEVANAKATVETNQVTSVTETSAICGGIITADGGSDITIHGVCWSTSPSPTIENDTTIAAAGKLAFSSSIKGLSHGTTYYVRAYAVNKGGVAYGLNAIFTTKTFSITTNPISVASITATSAIGGGNIISDGDSSSLTVTARGVCWNTFPSPTIENSKTTDGVAGGRFNSNIGSLMPLTTYYVRAYATNSVCTIYGNEVSFVTQSGVIGLTTSAVSSITTNTATCGGNITSDGGAPVTDRGICWNTTGLPSTTDNKTLNGFGVGSYTSELSGLTYNTTYYVRAYATNQYGTIYGDELHFTTFGIPDRDVYFKRNINTEQLTPFGAYIYVTQPIYAIDRIGFGGLLIYHAMDNLFYAVDLACPNESNSKVIIGRPNDLGMCQCSSCGEVYDMCFGQGTPTKGISISSLKQYTVSFDGNDFIYVTK